MKLYQGIVVNNNDPSKIGRVQVRIPELHGGSSEDHSYVQDDALPWYKPCIPWYSGYQSGSFMAPPIDSVIWCMNCDSYNIYLGGSYGEVSSSTKKFNNKVVPSNKPETPDEALQEYPNSVVIFKSVNGSIIWVDSGGTIVISSNNNNSIISVNEDTILLNNSNSSILINPNEINITSDKVIINGTEIGGD